MAIYHYRVEFVSRSTGRSSVQCAAYITGTRLKESRRDITADYRNRSSDVIFFETFAPQHASDYMKTLSVWDLLESYEDQYVLLRYRTESTQEKYKNSAQLAQTTVVALPKELSPDVWQELVTDFVNERFVSRGLVVTVAIHNDEENPHAHFLISRRAVTDKGEWSWTKDREITTRSELIESRRLWAEKSNFYLSREGFDLKIDHRSYADMGLPFEPTQHEGWYARKLERDGLKARISEENRETKSRNKEHLSLHPEAILKELTHKQATFSSLDLSRLIQQRLGDDALLASYIFEASLSQAVVVGSSLDGQTRYTSQEYSQLETQALSLSDTLMNNKAKLVVERGSQEAILKNQYDYLNSEQQQVVKALCDEQQLSVLVGRAGTGKTTTLKAVVELHTQAGYKVCGLSLSAVAAENLELETHCPSETVAFYLDKWNRREEVYQAFWSIHSSSEHPFIAKQLQDLERYTLTEQHLVILDEAGMIGTAQWASVLHYIEKAKAKLIVVGDDHQFKAIEAGDLFRKLKEKAHEHNKLFGLDTIIRQKESWMRMASKDLAELSTYQALAAYEQQGHIKRLATPDLQSIAKAYVQQRNNFPEQSGLLLASTRAQYQGLNNEVRQLLKEQGLISKEEIVINGRSFSVGDEIVFLKNDRGKAIWCFDAKTMQSKNILVKNGTRAKILRIENNIQNFDADPLHKLKVTVTAELKKGLFAKFNSENYEQFDHSYAITLHKAQGQTVDWAMILASKNMDAYAIYVALTRHRSTVTLFYDTQTFPEFKDLQRSLSRLSNKDLVIDYTIRPEHQGAWENVQEYLLLGQDLVATLREKDWSAYQGLKKERDILGQIILSEWEEHVSYARQAGLSKESLEISCGLKMRPLSLVEQNAYLTIQQYAQKAMEARLLWREIRHTHPGRNCYEHSKYSAFAQLRQERNKLAEEIVNNRPLYKQFIGKLAQELGIGWRALTNQAKQKIFSHEDFYKPHFKKKRDYCDSSKDSSVKVGVHQVKQELNERIALLAKELLGDPSHHTAREWRYGKKGSISICVAGAKQGLYSDFERGSYGGALKFIQDRLNLDYKEAYRWALDWLGHTKRQTPSIARPEAGMPLIQDKGWLPLFPVPSDVVNNQQMQKCINYQREKHNRQETARYAYRDAEGNLLGYTLRLENEQGKVVLPLTYCQSPNGKHRQWRWQGFGIDRPLYGLDKLKAHPNKPVLVVEGEKTADAAQKLFPGYAVVTWLGGTGSISKTDWSPLIDREVVLWPDNDIAGQNAANKIVESLAKIDAEKALETHIVKLPSDTPEKWDLADSLPAGWSHSTLREILNSVKEHQNVINLSYIKETFLKYRLEKPVNFSDGEFENDAKRLFNRMALWPKVLGDEPIEGKQKLMEKAVITEAIRYDAKKEYCFLAESVQPFV